jgi:proline racemase
MAHFEHLVATIDAHTGGEPVRIVLSGFPAIKGQTIVENKRYLKQHLDGCRAMLMQEPRGHRDMFGIILMPSCNDRADYGVLFIDNSGYLDMCGHSIIGVTTALIETGIVPMTEPETVIVFDTPAGLVSSHARIEQHRVVDVSFVNVPSFLYMDNLTIETASHGKVRCDISFGGNFFAAVDVHSLGLELCLDNLPALIRLGLEIKQTVNSELNTQHPKDKHIDRVELTEFYYCPDPSVPFAKSLVVFGTGQFDRSPCGTGLSATMATLHARGKLPLNTEFVAESVIGTRFCGELVQSLDLHGYPAVIPRIKGNAYLTGMHQFITDPNDPFKYGFKIESSNRI